MKTDIKIFTTGGTIDKVYFDAKSEFEIGDPQILPILEEANVTFGYKIERLLTKDSLELTDQDRDRIAQAVRETKCKHILITHGTDTMVNTAKVLYDIPDKVIVLVGSLKPARFKESDAIFNIGFALGALMSMPAGVYITMNGTVFDPHSVRKNRNENRFEPI